MSISNIASPLVSIDVLADYIPVVSTLTNLVVLFQKCLVVPFTDVKYVESSHYFTHLKNKSFLRCMALLVPLLGNLVIVFYDLASIKVKHDRENAEPMKIQKSSPIP